MRKKYLSFVFIILVCVICTQYLLVPNTNLDEPKNIISLIELPPSRPPVQIPSQKEQDALDIVEAIIELQGKNTHRIPPFIHQTWKKHGGRNIDKSVDSFKQLNPDHTHILWDDESMERFVQKYHPVLYKHYRSLKIIMKADWFRYLVLYTFGGVYSDIDTRCLKPIESWASDNPNVIIGLEADVVDREDWYLMYAHKIQFCQWTLASTPYHPLFASVIFKITSRLTELPPNTTFNSSMVIDLTGPGAWTLAIYEHIKLYDMEWSDFANMREPKVVGDIAVLPITGFSPGVGHMGSQSVFHPQAKVQHMFLGSWKRTT